jgi:Zinc carboxypeptidase
MFLSLKDSSKGRSLLYPLFVLLFATTWTFSIAAPTLELIPGEQMNLDLSNSPVTANNDEWDIVLYLRDDNGDTSLADSYRSHWHVQISGLDSVNGQTMNFQVQNRNFLGEITPFLSLDGGLTYNRIHNEPGYRSSADFTLTTPPGVESIRLARYAPYTFTHFETVRTRVKESPHVTEIEIGRSSEDRSMYMFELTDRSIPDTNKKRVWVHAAVHPGENTAYFTAEGLLNWLVSKSPDAEILLDHLIFDIIPIANPDGTWHGNSRTTAQSVNMEVQYAPPWDTTVPECRAIQDQVEAFMGTEASPGPNPILMLLNVHSTHGNGYPFHFVHRPNYNINGTGVIPEVNALENRWVQAFRQRSELVNRGNDASSSLSGRPYIESLMHDKYSLFEDVWEPVMAITLEGTFQYSLVSGEPNTPDDYRQMGMEMGLAIADYFEISLDFPGDSWLIH